MRDMILCGLFGPVRWNPEGYKQCISELYHRSTRNRGTNTGGETTLLKRPWHLLGFSAQCVCLAHWIHLAFGRRISTAVSHSISLALRSYTGGLVQTLAKQHFPIWLQCLHSSTVSLKMRVVTTFRRLRMNIYIYIYISFRLWTGHWRSTACHCFNTVLWTLRRSEDVTEHLGALRGKTIRRLEGRKN